MKAETVDGSSGMGGALALVSQGEAVMRIENESLMQVAIQRPRDEQKVLDGALKELDLVPEEAASAYYSIPYKDNQSGQQQMVEGPSIKAAMALARRWGNCSAAARVLSEDATGINVEGVFIDFESSFRVLRPHRVNRFFKRRTGQVIELSPDRLQMATQAGASKALRNAILAGLPAYLVNTYFKKAKTIVAGGTLDERPTQPEIDKAVRAFAPYHVTAEQLEKNLELPRTQWTRESIATLRGLYTALKDGQTTVEEAFGGAPVADAEKAVPAAGSKLDQLADQMGTSAQSGGDHRNGAIARMLAQFERWTPVPDMLQRQAIYQGLFSSTDLEKVDVASIETAVTLFTRVAEGDAEAKKSVEEFQAKAAPKGKK